MDGERPMEQPQPVVVVATAIAEEDGHTPSRPSSSRARTRRRRNRPASADASDRDSSVERDRGRRRPTSAATFGSPERVQVSAKSAAPVAPASYNNAWGALESPLQSVDEGPDDSGARIPPEEETDEERLERHLRLERRSKRQERGRSNRSARRRDDNDTGGGRERRSGGSRRGRSARRRSRQDNYDDDAEVLEDMHRVPEERGSAGRPATATGTIRVPQSPSDRMYGQRGSVDRPVTAGTTRVPHAPSNFRPSSASVAPFRPVSARPTSRPSEMVGMPPNMDGRNWVQPNRPAVEEQLKRRQRQRSARRVKSARSTRSFEERERLASQDTVRAAEGVKPEPWMTAEEGNEQKSKWWAKSKAVQVAAAVTHSADGKVKVKQKLHFDGSPKTAQQARKEQKKDAVEVFIFEHQRELIEYFQSGLFQMQLPRATSLIRKALGVRPGLRRLLALLCCATLALGVYAAYLVAQVDFARGELDELRVGGVSNEGGAESTRTYSTTVALSRKVVPYNQFARVCRCAHRPARPVPPPKNTYVISVCRTRM